jgi:hypothetical protein
MEPASTGVKTWQWVVTVIVIIVLIIIGYNIFSGSSSSPAVTDDTTATTPANSKDVNRVVVSDQFPGNIVYISSVQLSQPGFIVIHKDNAGTPGDIIGYQYFDKGINPGKITLTSPTVEGGIYYAMLHSDNGDKKFDAAKDLPLKDASGNIIMKLFRASSTVTEVKG